MGYSVIFTPEAEDQLTELYRYIAADASPEIALRFTDSIVSHCESLCNFPLRGTRRDDIRPGLRTTGYRRRVVIAFEASSTAVNIIGVFYGGQDYESALREEDLSD